MTIASALKYVAVGGVAFGLSAVPHRAMRRTFTVWFWEYPGLYSSVVFSICLLVLSTFEFFSAAMAIRASPRQPGAGRWIWAIFGGVVVLEFSLLTILHSIHGTTPGLRQVTGLFRCYVLLMSMPSLIFGLKIISLLLWLGGRAAGVSKPPRMDAQEWSARALVILLPLFTIAFAIWR